jgi:mono/diheme cytochrome c family protein
MKKAALILLVLTLSFLTWLFLPESHEDYSHLESLSPDQQRGQTLLKVAGCYACHTAGFGELAGGVRLDSEFGTFITPNITMSFEQGIGDWQVSDFAAALKEGVSKDGQVYYPAFPYTSYQHLNDQDIVDMWAALQSYDVSETANQAHRLGFPFNVRQGVKLWQSAFLKSQAPSYEDKEVQRGWYLATALMHCGECHTPRGFAGNLDFAQHFQGSSNLPHEASAPPITAGHLIANGWTEDDLLWFFEMGMLLDGDFVGGSMAEVIDYGTTLLSEDDWLALSTYLLHSQ